MVFITNEELRETLRMIEAEHLDIRAVTMGISLRDCATATSARTCQRVYDKIDALGRPPGLGRQRGAGAYGVPITNKRISVTPIALVGEPTRAAAYVPLAETLDRAGAELGIDYVAGFSALVEKGITPGDAVLLDSIPEALAVTQRVCSSVNVATTRAGINMDAIAHMGRIIKRLAERTADRGGIGCAKLVVFANIPDDNPFVAGAHARHRRGRPRASTSASRARASCSRRGRRASAAASISATSPRPSSAWPSRSRAPASSSAARWPRSLDGARFGIVDLSLAPTPAIGDSVAEILEALGLERTGAPGTTAALALLTDAVKKGGVMASSSVGGLSGAFIPVSEDHGMMRRGRAARSRSRSWRR